MGICLYKTDDQKCRVFRIMTETSFFYYKQTILRNNAP